MTKPYPAEAVERLRQRCDLASYRDEWTVSDVAPDDLAALLSYVEGMKWRPIESAPKDETIIDLYADNERYPECWWSGERWISYLGGFRKRAGEAWFEIETPTHWLPLHPAPDGEG